MLSGPFRAFWGHFGIAQLGKNYYCLKYQSGIGGGQGYFGGYDSYYDLSSYTQFPEVFSYNYYDSNEGAVTDNSGYTKETEISIHPAGDYYSIELTTTSNKVGAVTTLPTLLQLTVTSL